MLDAAFDADAGDPPPCCHPETRQSIINSMLDIIRDPNTKARLSWLYGGAGVGKSAIMQTVVEAEAENALCTSLFFSRTSKRNDPRKVFPTISFQLAVKNQSYQRYITEQIVADPLFLSKSMDKLFGHLITIPIAKKQLLGDSRKCVIFLDGLDECKGVDEQCRIVELIHDFVLHHPTVPVQWIIASRPEEHLRVTFLQIRTSNWEAYWVREVQIDSDEAVRDVELYLHAEFKKIKGNHPNLIPEDMNWPNSEQFLKISRAALGLFVFASTIIGVIGDRTYRNPVKRLNLVLSVLEQRLAENLPINSFELLDMLNSTRGFACNV